MSLRNFLTFIREASASHLAGIVPILPVVGAAVASIGFFILGNWLVALITGISAVFLSVLFAGAIHFARWMKHRSDLSCLIGTPKARRLERSAKPLSVTTNT